MPEFYFDTDKYFMEEAVKEAMTALKSGEVPIGAVITDGSQIIARAHNQVVGLRDATAHAEIIALTAASDFLGNPYLMDCSIYVTVEPCIMCAGALYWSRIGTLVYGAADNKRGFMRYGKELLHPRTAVKYGIMNSECSYLLQSFFEKKRM